MGERTDGGTNGGDVKGDEWLCGGENKQRESGVGRTRPAGVVKRKEQEKEVWEKRNLQAMEDLLAKDNTQSRRS